MRQIYTFFSAWQNIILLYAQVGESNTEKAITAYYSWDDTTLSIPDQSLSLNYRSSDNVFVRPMDDPESAQMMEMLGLDEFLYHQQ